MPPRSQRALGIVPESLHVGARNFGKGGAAVASDFFHLLKAASELCVGLMERDFGIDFEVASEINSDEEQIA